MRRKYLDILERVVWTAIQATCGALLDVLTQGEITWRAAGYATAIALLKCVVATRVGDRDSAAALPGG